MTQRRARLLALFVLAAVTLTVLSCKPKARGEFRRYEITGRVVSVDKDAHQVVLAHQEIPGFMKAMTMGFKVKEQWALDAMAAGDRVNAVLVVDPEGAYLQNPVITKASATEPEASTSSVHEPRVGDDVPDFELVNQAGKKVTIRQFRGRPLLLTFIYTRCPLPDYCIRMSNNFAEIEKDLRTVNPKLYDEVRLLSVSIDPEYDKPEVLRKYSKQYAGEVDPELRRWTFAGGSQEQVRKIADYFGLAYEKQSGQIIHSLRTAVIGRDGKIAFVYNGNDWKPDEVVRDLKTLR